MNNDSYISRHLHIKKHQLNKTDADIGWFSLKFNKIGHTYKLVHAVNSSCGAAANQIFHTLHRIYQQYSTNSGFMHYILQYSAPNVGSVPVFYREVFVISIFCDI